MRWLDSDQRASLFTMGVALIFVIVWCLVSPPKITWACPPDNERDSLEIYMPIWDDDTTNWDEASWYGPVTVPAIANIPDSLVIFYVDTVAWKRAEKIVQTECFLDNRGPGAHFSIGCAVYHWKTIRYWTPIVETTVVATYPISSKAKRDRWQWRIK